MYPASSEPVPPCFWSAEGLFPKHVLPLKSTHKQHRQQALSIARMFSWTASSRQINRTTETSAFPLVFPSSSLWWKRRHNAFQKIHEITNRLGRRA
ncbi:unnamed protein product [Ectocarpus sp. 6 AP-2014]